MPYNVSSWFVDQQRLENPSIKKNFTIGGSDYTRFVDKWPTVSRQWDDPRPVSVSIGLANEDQTFNFIREDKTKLLSRCEVKLGFEVSRFSNFTLRKSPGADDPHGGERFLGTTVSTSGGLGSYVALTILDEDGTDIFDEDGTSILDEESMSDGRDFRLSALVYSPYSDYIIGSATRRLSVENPDYSGYGVRFDMGSGYLDLRIETRSAHTVAALSAVVSMQIYGGGNPLANVRLKAELIRSGSGTIAANLYHFDISSLLLSVTTSDATYSGGFDRLVVRGGYTYYVDVISFNSTTGSFFDELDNFVWTNVKSGQVDQFDWRGGAIALSSISAGALVGISVINPGSMYGVAPLVSISGPGSGATAVSTILTSSGYDYSGGVSSVFISGGGAVYSFQPIISFATDEMILAFGGTLEKVQYKDTQVDLTITDKLRRLSERVVGTSNTPAVFSSSTLLPSDIVWTLCTCYGGFSGVQSISNPDIDYAAFQSYAAVWSLDNVLMSARFRGQKVTECLRKVAQMTQSSVVLALDKLTFARFSVVNTHHSLLDGRYIISSRLDIDELDMVNRQWVYADYRPDSGSWNIAVFDQNTSSINSYGPREDVIKDESVWYVNSSNALNMAQRIISTAGLPYDRVTADTMLAPLHHLIGDTISVNDPLLVVTPGWRIMKQKLNIDNGAISISIDGSQINTPFILDVSSLDGPDLLL